MSTISAMNHFTIVTTNANLEATTKFYGLFGLRPGARPNMPVPGVWMYADSNPDHPILHVIIRKQLPTEPDGLLDHMAFTATDLPGVAKKLVDMGLEYDLRKVPDYGSWQLFCRDPNGARVEFDFEKHEKQPEGWKGEKFTVKT